MVPAKKTSMGSRGSMEAPGAPHTLFAITEQKSGPPSVISEGDSSRTAD